MDSSSSSSLKERHEDDASSDGFEEKAQPEGLEPLHAAQTNRTHRTVAGANAGLDLLNLPSRTLTTNARMEEYTTETADGQMLKVVKSNRTGKLERYELVTFKHNDPENPKNWYGSTELQLVPELIYAIIGPRDSSGISLW